MVDFKKKLKSSKKSAREIQKEMGRWYRLNFAVLDKSPNVMVFQLGIMLNEDSNSKQVIRGEGSGSMSERDTGLAIVRECALCNIMIRAMMYAELNETFLSFEEAINYWELSKENGAGYHLSHMFETFAIMYDKGSTKPYSEGEDLHRIWAQRVFNCAFALVNEYQLYHNPLTAMMAEWERVKKTGPVFQG